MASNESKPAEPPIELPIPAMKAIIVNELDQVLFLEENGEYEYAANGGKLQVPGGKLDVGLDKDENACLTREVREETGLSVTIGEPVGYGSWAPVIPGLQRARIVGMFVICQPKDPGAEVQVEAKKHRHGLWLGQAAFERANADGRIIPPDNAMVAKFFRNKGHYLEPLR